MEQQLEMDFTGLVSDEPPRRSNRRAKQAEVNRAYLAGMKARREAREARRMTGKQQAA